ncbi:MAG: glycerophosphodiester phosphodiesterase family protein [Bacteroidales bacterium]|jgi:glycerophosphoryl diester phosphodiesterase|nr:glycerophosphodiester phosphodiesterase family protein [Bacteroidales bacterium]
MKKIILFLYCWLFIPVSFSQTRVDSLLRKLHSPDNDYVFVVAHRADWRNAPENSNRAIELAIAMGADMVEIDIRKTKDDQFVVIHDKTIDRTMTGKGKVEEFTVEELKKLRLRAGNGIKTYEHIPTLEEALFICKDRILVNIDKGGTYIKEITPILRKTDTEKQVIIKGKYTVAKVKEEYGKNTGMLYMPIVDIDKPESWIELSNFLKDFKPIAVEACFKTDNFKELNRLSEITRQGSRIWINTLWDTLCGGHDDESAMTDKDANWGWVIKQGATLIQTDRPKELIRYLKEKGLRNL